MRKVLVVDDSISMRQMVGYRSSQDGEIPEAARLSLSRQFRAYSMAA